MTYQVINFGCRLNSFEGEVIKKALGGAAPAGEVIVLNSCAVTQEAEKQLRQTIRKTRRQKPDASIIVTGCAAQINPDFYATMPEVDHVLGNIEKLESASYQSLLPHIEQESRPKAQVQDIMMIKETAAHLVSSFEGKTRAFLEIQNGCNHRCTFCIIPFGRGNNRSVPLGDIVERVRELVANGFKEVVLTGVDISGYGEDLPGQPTLTEAIRRILKLVPELSRLRLSSVDVAELSEDFLSLLTAEPRLMPHLHLSIQAGDDMILKRMKRRHLRQDVFDFCAKAKRLRPDIVFGADIITGFPTETEEMFQNTLDLVEQIGIPYLHVFPYSARQGTPAAKMPQVPVADRKSRAARLRALGTTIFCSFLEKKIGNTYDILIESSGMGRTEDHAEIKLEGEFDVGSLIKATVTHLEDGVLYGRVTG
ncbi:MAG: tRNA (N(6)-L-threonylcarbamoyladenosine(37)-C(2))-methylthiotransferase MtaB [Alphaproteobacteria bacterium]|nr:tRNA (N(6)-L-threonylcarbamoyladenosine(37)-C(2))-methylthiotransferase MtaB [Alphaproteobacteria bacterium]